MTFTFDRLIDQIIDGRKTATADRIEEQGYLDEWDTGLGIGFIYTVHDSNRVPRCRIKVVRLELCKWESIPEWLWKGETNQSAEEFREDHIEYFGGPDTGFEFVGIEFELVEVLKGAESSDGKVDCFGKPRIDSEVSLREVTPDSVREICDLSVFPAQEKFVAPNGTSIAQAHFSDKAWFRAVYADETPVGFVMLEVDQAKPEYYLWRFMIDARFQKMQFGSRAMKQLIAHVSMLPDAVELLTSVVQEPGGPQTFYEGIGFRLTGEFEDGEAMMILKLP